MSFSEMTDILGVSNSFLTYHLENLGELVGKTEDGKYKLSSFGEAANATMNKVEDIPTIAPHNSKMLKTNWFRGRSAVVALGIVCILLIAGLGGTIAYYATTINNKQSELNSANKTINQLNATIAKQNDTVSQLNSTITNLQNQIASGNATITTLKARVIIDGITYSTTRTPYDCLMISYFTLLPKAESDPNMDFGMLWQSQFCWLLTPGEPLPPDSLVEVSNGSTPFIMVDPDPWGQVMINNWLYNQIPTNFTEFTMPYEHVLPGTQQLTNITLWTCTASEPIPTNATVLH
jgi:uncharacterized coiled-coil protein SlyX